MSETTEHTRAPQANRGFEECADCAHCDSSTCDFCEDADQYEPAEEMVAATVRVVARCPDKGTPGAIWDMQARAKSALQCIEQARAAVIEALGVGRTGRHLGVLALVPKTKEVA